MFAKLALRNVRRQVGNYLIYFITVTFTVALMFAIHNVIYSEDLSEFSHGFQDMKQGLIALSVLVSLVVSFVLGYATSFLLRLRKREFGTYLTLGMTRRNIRTLFILEMLLLGSAALVLGIVLGLFLYQGLMVLVMNLMQMELDVSGYSVKALVLTVVLVAVVFLLASLTAGRYLKRATIQELIHGDQKVTRNARHPVLWLGVSAASLAGIVAGFFIFDRQMTLIAAENGNSMGWLYCMIFFAVCLFLFHVGLCRSIVWLLMRSRKFCARGSNTFVLRQLSGQLGANAVIAGILSVLIAFSIIGADAALAYKSTLDTSLDRAMPFDVMTTFEPDEQGTAFSGPEAEREFEDSVQKMNNIIGSYNAVMGEYPYRIYTDGSQDITGPSGLGYESLKDFYIPISMYNTLLAAAGLPELTLGENEYFIVQEIGFDTEQYRDIPLVKNGVTAVYGGSSRELPLFMSEYFVTVVPDSMVQGMMVASYHVGFNLKEGGADASALQQGILDATKHQDINDQIGVQGSGIQWGIKELSRQYQNGTVAVLITGALYVSVTFVLLAIAVLALKVLAGFSDDRRRYAILFRIGCGRRGQRQALFRQLAVFFFLPFIVPIASTVPIAAIIGRMMEGAGLTALSSSAWSVTAAVAALTTVIYVLYFAATYLIARREVVYNRS